MLGFIRFLGEVSLRLLSFPMEFLGILHIYTHIYIYIYIYICVVGFGFSSQNSIYNVSGQGTLTFIKLS